MALIPLLALTAAAQPWPDPWFPSAGTGTGTGGGGGSLLWSSYLDTASATEFDFFDDGASGLTYGEYDPGTPRVTITEDAVRGLHIEASAATALHGGVYLDLPAGNWQVTVHMSFAGTEDASAVPMLCLAEDMSGGDTSVDTVCALNDLTTPHLPFVSYSDNTGPTINGVHGLWEGVNAITGLWAQACRDDDDNEIQLAVSESGQEYAHSVVISDAASGVVPVHTFLGVTGAGASDAWFDFYRRDPWATPDDDCGTPVGARDE